MASKLSKHITPVNIGLVIGGLFLLMYVRKTFGNTLGPNGKKTTVPTDPLGQGRTQAEIESIARSQYSAMDRIGTDLTTLFGSLEGLSGNDLKRVFNAFGTKGYFLFGGSALFDKPLDLFGWYREELGGSDLDRMRSIWQRAGMTV